MTPRTSHDVPRVDLAPVRHQHVRRMLVDEARRTAARTERVRRLAPAAVAVAVAATVAAVSVGPGEVVRAAQSTVGQLSGTDPEDVTCETGAVMADPSYGEGIRLLAPDPGDLTLEAAWVNATPACQLESRGTPIQVVAALAPDGTIASALTVWRDVPVDPASDAGRALAGVPEGSPRQRVRGHDGAVDVAADIESVRVWWIEDAVAWSVEASGLGADVVLATVEQLDLGADRPLAPDAFPPGAAGIDGWTTPSRRDVEPVWYADYVGAATAEDPDSDAGRPGFHLTVSARDPWQTQLRAGHRIVDVNGVAAVAGSQGGGGSVPFVTWQVREGLQATLEGRVPGGPDELLTVAESLEPVEADDPRIVPLS